MDYIYPERTKISNITLYNDDFRNQIDDIKQLNNIIVVTDPPFNVGYHYGEYKDNMEDSEYYQMLVNIVTNFNSVFIHYPEALYRLAVESGKVPTKVCSWIYNSNTAKQHRDIAYFGIVPDLNKIKQPYKNPTDKRIMQRIEDGKLGGRLYDWWYVDQIKNVSEEKTEHPCQMPIEVMKNIIASLPEDSIIFDPFTGSGTTGIACSELGYDFIGCELDNNYYNIAKNRIEGSQNNIKSALW